MAKRVDGAQGDATLGIVHVPGEELAQLGLVFLVAAEVTQCAEGAGVAAGGELGPVVLQRVADLGDVGRPVLFAQRAHGGVGELVAERVGAKRGVDQLARLLVVMPGEAADDAGADGRIFLAVQALLERAQGGWFVLAGDVADDLLPHLGVGLVDRVDQHGQGGIGGDAT